MKISSGTRLGSYEILSALGAGGMGEVWKAQDSKLRRHVAIKTLPDVMAQDPDRLARLEREAELLASLNHPNIAIIHGLDESDGTRFLVLELVEGLTLEDRLQRGPVSTKEALKLALQIAEALEAAHERGVVHRDLKPANVKVTPEGRVKVLDFGLAKTLGPSADDALTQNVMSTQPGLVVGTPAYMSPEQARGEVAGPQSDIWSFGVVFYELLSGKSPFKQNTTAETIAKLMAMEPDYSALPPDTPSHVRRLIRRCLEKDRKRRLQHIGDVRLELEEALAAPESPALDGTRPATHTGRRWAWVAGAVAVSVIAGLAGWLIALRNTPSATASMARLSIPFFDRPMNQPFGARHLAISRDGARMAYASFSRLLIRQMSRSDPVVVSEALSNPFFSPDGKWIGGFSDGVGLFKASVDGGAPIRLAQTSSRPAGAAWGYDGTIVFATSEGLFQVSENGGEARPLIKPDADRKERLYAWPELLPDGRSILFTVVLDGQPNQYQIDSLDLKTLDRKTVVNGGSSARVSPGGHLIYTAGAVLKAVKFDPAARRILGDPVSIADVEVMTAADNGAADFAVSDTGTLAFLPPPAVTTGLRTLMWVDRRGQREPVAIEPGPYGYPRVSPDGTRAALDISRGGNRDIWILNFERLTLSRLTDGPTEDMLPIWTRDSKRVFFASNRSGTFDVYSQPADGATGARVEFSGPGTQIPNSMTPDGTSVLVYEDFKDVAILDLAHPEQLTPLLHRDSDDRLTSVSPDGHWLVYESDEAGKQFEVYVRPFPNVADRREKISINGGRYPVWGPAGSDQLYYVSPNGEMMAASVKLSPSFAVGAVTKLFDYQKPSVGRSGTPYDVAPDGRFLIAEAAATDSSAPTQVSVLLNWLEELKKLTLRQ